MKRNPIFQILGHVQNDTILSVEERANPGEGVWIGANMYYVSGSLMIL